MLREGGEENAAHYFEQCSSFMRDGKDLPTDRRKISFMLGL